MLPGDGRNVFEQMTGNGPALALQRIDDAGEVDGIPENDRTDHEIEAGGAKGLAVEGAVADLAALVKKTARFNLWADSPLLRPPRQRRRNLGSQYHSTMKRERSRRPTSRRARASSLNPLDAESFFRIVEGATMRSFIDAAIRSNSSQLSRMRSMLILGPR